MRSIRGLTTLARLYRVEPHYEDMNRRRRTPDAEAALLVLRALGADLGPADDVRQAIRHRRAELESVSLQRVHVAWQGSLDRVPLRLPHNEPERVALELRLESGIVRALQATAAPARLRSRRGWQATHVVELDARLPIGYHDMVVETRGGTFDALVIAAPRRAHAPERRDWGVFVPLYALHSHRSRIGDFADLERLAVWAGALGAGFVSTLPLLATFLSAPFEPSPYSPASRLFWNELFLDLHDVPGWNEALACADPDERGDEGDRDLVDFRRTAAVRRRLLERALRAGGAENIARASRFADANRHAADYARFRAVGDHRRVGWTEWPGPLRDGSIREGDFAPEDFEYHLFAQAETDRQLAGIANTGRVSLYLDMPLGVHPESYDAWRFRSLFAPDVSAGAPPDPLFTGGQNWGFRPQLPERLREDRYAYFIDALRHHLRHARMLRLDHVMSLRRLFWVPDGLPATRGVYVRYPEEELFAVLVLESARHEAVIIGEDLGTVPPAVRTAMRRHGVHRMHVVQFEATENGEPVLTRPPADSIASLNTHDMPTFAGFCRGSDIDDQLDLGLIDDEQHRQAQRRRARLVQRLAPDNGADPAAIRDRLLEDLAGSAARYVLINLEDLWLEERPQNVPGTSTERPNWMRRVRPSLSEITDSATIRVLLESIDRRRAPLRARHERIHG